MLYLNLFDYYIMLYMAIDILIKRLLRDHIICLLYI